MSQLSVSAPIDSSGVLVEQMAAALATIERATVEDAGSLRTRASIIEAAAARAKSLDVQLAAARLRLHAERRIGELFDLGAHEGKFTSREVSDFRRLARIPRRYENVDLFDVSVEHQLDEGRSHTAYSVYMCSLHTSAKGHRDHGWRLERTWEAGMWLLHYKDPRTSRARTKTFTGTEEEALEERAVLSGRVSRGSVKLLPTRGQDPLAAVLDRVRGARLQLGEVWSQLSDEQRALLSGAYGVLDDLGLALVKAVNL